LDQLETLQGSVAVSSRKSQQQSYEEESKRHQTENTYRLTKMIAELKEELEDYKSKDELNQDQIRHLKEEIRDQGS
jgi:hypothetical protein